MIITSIPDLSLQYDEALSLLRVEWAAGEDMRSFRSSAELLLQLVNKHSIRHMLLEMNTFPDISVYDQVWLGVNWMPVLVKLPLEQVVVVISRRRVHNQLAIDSLIALFRPFIRFDIQFFSTVVPGLHWLSDYSGRVPGLMAEWDAVHGTGPAPGNVSEPRPMYML
ncbi:hypothetical protein ACFST9_10995 [Hymenobacter monticola]|uniref:STAS/SEC14 domain-containing protein n=1 Tax=Hymenobacter monticola TaxID=1705399 RepID=A0ABY4BAF9_9BACT|nr:hypothetical protein [Hymenobacter monticola]UOE35282.1 hypothetical protein MTP16_06415 [Hymenobacter monticola]